MNSHKLTSIVLGLTLAFTWSGVRADDFVPAVDTVPYNTSTSYTLDSGDSGGDITLQFGTTLAEYLKWNSAGTRFDLSDDLNLTGGLATSGGTNSLNSNSNFATDINTGTSTGAVSIGGGANTVAVNSTSWDVSAAGVGSGFTGLTSTGTVNFSGSTSFRLHEAAANPGACAEGQLFYNTTENQLEICNTTNTWVNGPDTATFTDATPAAFADNNTTELNNEATAPNITTDSATSTVLVSFNVQGAAADADNETYVVSIARNNAGANPSCGTDVQVGILLSAFKTDAGVWSVSGTFLDSPGVAGNIRYNVCSNSATNFAGDLDTALTAVNMTLVEMAN